METRRGFLTGVVFGGVSVYVAGSTLARAAKDPLRSQDPEPRPPMEPRPSHDPSPHEGPPMPDATKKVLEDNDKDMKKKVERLYELASQLKDQVDKTDSSKVLNLDLMKKAEEIERLARDIKNRSKG